MQLLDLWDDIAIIYSYLQESNGKSNGPKGRYRPMQCKSYTKGYGIYRGIQCMKT